MFLVILQDITLATKVGRQTQPLDKTLWCWSRLDTANLERVGGVVLGHTRSRFPHVSPTIQAHGSYCSWCTVCRCGWYCSVYYGCFTGRGSVIHQLDLSQACQQLLLDDVSKDLVTTNMHLGLYRYTRLTFGVLSVAAIFQCTWKQYSMGCLMSSAIYPADMIITGQLRKSIGSLSGSLGMIPQSWIPAEMTSACSCAISGVSGACGELTRSPHSWRLTAGNCNCSST